MSRGGYGKKNGVSTLFQIDKGRQIFFMPINYKYNPKHAVLPELCLLEEKKKQSIIVVNGYGQNRIAAFI